MDLDETCAAEGLALLDVGVAIFDRTSQLVYCNLAFRALRRYPEEVCQKGVTLADLLRFNAGRGDFGPGDVDEQVVERLNEIQQAEEREIEREMADGQILRIRYRRTASGGMLITLEDRTEERKAQKSLAASEERHMLVARATSDGIYDWDVSQDRLYVSDRLIRILDLELGGQASINWAERVHPDDYPAYRAAIRAHFKGDTDAIECEYRVRARDGGYRWIHDRGVGVRGGDGRVVRLVGAVRDITDAKEARAELDRTEARLMASLATISDGILLVDEDDRVQLWNNRYYEIFTEAAGGADLSEVIVKGRSFFDMIRDGYRLGMFKPHPDGVDAWVSARKRAWDQPVSQWELELSNGRWILLNERRMPEGGRVSVYTDITELKEREAAAQAARQRFEEAIEAVSSGFAMWDAADRLVVCNSRYRHYFADLADMVTPGRPFRDVMMTAIERGLFPGEEANAEAFLAATAEKRARATGEPREQHLADGHWLQITDHRTTEGGIVSIYTDVTRLKISEQAAQAARQRFEEAIEAVSSGFSLWDADDRLVVCNSTYRKFYQDLADIVEPGVRFRDVVSLAIKRGLIPAATDDPESYLQANIRRRAQGLGHVREHRLSSGRWLQITDHRTAEGGIVSVHTDVTALKNREEELRAALAEFNAVLDTIDYGVLFMDSDLRARIVNRAFGRIWNIPQAYVDQHPSMRELIEFNRDTGIYNVAPKDWDRWVNERIAQIRAGDIAPGEFHRADGRVLSYQCVSLPDGGRMLSYFDITELKEREAEIARARDTAEAALADLQRAQERLIQAEKMASLGQLTAGIAHEIKNPLNFVNNFAKLSDELLEELAGILETHIAALDAEARGEAEDLLKTVRENLAKIAQHGQRADSIVKNMLLHAREGPSERQSVGLNALAEEALNLAYHGARAEHPGFNIEIVKSLDPEVGAIECYPQDLMRVFLNLISNGMYAADKRRTQGDGFSPAISLTTRTNGEAVEIEVRDNGTGIPPELRERIFLPFFTTKPAGEGTGLGLSLSYDIVVKQHGGEISVESEPGAFTAFRVSLPQRMPTGPQESQSPEEGQ